MREIHAHNIHASLDHVIQNFGVVSRRTKGRDYLGSSLHIQLRLCAKKNRVGEDRTHHVGFRSGINYLPGAFFQYRYGRQCLAFQVFQEGATGCGYVRHLVVNIILLDGRNGVATTRQAETLGIGNRH